MLQNTRLLTAVVLAIALPFGAAFAQADPAMVGTWTGNAVQTYPDGTIEEFPANVVLLADGTGTTEYPTYACSGTLAPVLDMGPAAYRETITVGIETCANNGIFAFTLAADGLHFEWTSEKFGTAAGVLQRGGGK